MRALTISAHGTLDRLEYREDLPEPELSGPRDVRVRMRAASLNHLDVFVVEGLPGVSITPPWIMGGDGTGVIESVGPEVRSVKPGDHVLINPGISDRTCIYCESGEQSLCLRYQLLGEHLPGVLAEYVVLPEFNVRRIPADAPVPEAASFTLANLTAWRMLVTRAGLKEGDDVLIQGIGGGVAQAAFAIAKLHGARVWVTSTSDEKLERARALGAHETINNRKEDVARVVRQRTNKRGVDIVIDSVGEATWPSSVGSLTKEGRLVTCGGTSGPMVTCDVRRLFWHHLTIMGSTMGNDMEFDIIAEHFRWGRLHPVIDSVFELADGRAAFERMAAGDQFGKIVVSIA